MRNKKSHKTKHREHLARSSHLSIREHLRELRGRVTIVALTIAVMTCAAYALEQRLIDILLRPSHGQKFIYTTPLGGLNFLFSVCLDVGLILATPVIVYHALQFIAPLMRTVTRRFVAWTSLAMFVVALGGVTFGYFIGLPSALHFLLHQFESPQIRPLITIQSYLSFVSVYLLGSALMFQIPLIALIINKIKPLKPSRMLRYERHAILGAFITAFIMNPTPNLVDQMLVVVPIILAYQIAILFVWLANRKDEELAPQPAPAPTSTHRPIQKPEPAQPSTPQKHPKRVMDVSPPRKRPQPALTVAKPKKPATQATPHTPPQPARPHTTRYAMPRANYLISDVLPARRPRTP